MPSGTTSCHLCGAAVLAMIPDYAALPRVTSDCKPWPAGGKLGVCPGCGGVQKVIDDAWHAEVQNIYRAYEIYHQSGGVEQAVFHAGTGQAVARSQQLLTRFLDRCPQPPRGRWLDVGCGNGALLRACGQVLPGWELVGTELGSKYKPVVESIPGVAAMYDGPPEAAPGRFNVISMVHVLEHIPTPRPFLRGLADQLAAGGMLLIEVPDHRRNPFDLLIADHSTHFTAEALTHLLVAAGFQVRLTTTQWIAKELSAAATPTDAPGAPRTTPTSDVFPQAQADVRWLADIVHQVRALAARQSLGVFGTSIAGTWVAQLLGERVAFFVDEDPARAGAPFMGRPVLHPRAVPESVPVFLALPAELAKNIAARLARPGVVYHIPPPLP